MTWLGLLNFIVLQWFGVRLARSFTGPSYGNDSYYDYRWLCWAWPLTGWWSDYRWIARRP